MLRDNHDLRGAQIDEIIGFSVDNDLISIWRDGVTGEMWVTALIDQEEEGDEGGEEEDDEEDEEDDDGGGIRVNGNGR